jgi:tRNA pseudouridine55 synthase
VLPIAVGEATKLAGRLLDSDKVYSFTIRFGEETDTLDAEGKVVATSEARPSLDAVEEVLPDFTGAIQQMPPAYSALRVDGERAYDLARAGADFELIARSVTIHELRASAPLREQENGLAQRRRGAESLNEVTLTAGVSKGTYIRSLARDIARALGTVGHVTMLRREKAGPFTLAQAISLDILDAAAKGHALEQSFLPLRAGLDDIPALSLTPDQAGLLRQGRQVVGIAAPDGQCLCVLDDVPVALAEVQAGSLRVVRGFNL